MLYRKIFILSHYLGNKHFYVVTIQLAFYLMACTGLGHVSKIDEHKRNTYGIYLFRQCNNKSDDNRMHLCNRCYFLTSDWIQIFLGVGTHTSK